VLLGYLSESKDRDLNQLEMLGDQKEVMSEVLSELSSLKVTQCLLVSWLKGFEFSGQSSRTKLEYFLEDRVREQKNTVNSTYKLLLTRLGKRESNNALASERLKELAIMIAANEVSFSAIEKETLPNLFAKVEGAIAKIADLETRVEFLDLKYKDQFKSLCDRVENLEADVNRLKNQYRERSTSGSSAPKSLLIPQSPASSSISIQKWQPMAYFDLANICKTATLLERDYTYNATVVYSNGQRATVQRFGDVYKDCGGKIVMVLR
jgi:hypothetical protein